MRSYLSVRCKSTFTNHRLVPVRGSVLGATLTVPASEGMLLTTFLALFVSWVGLEVWSLLSYGLHEWRSTPESRDAFHHQQQVLLRSGLTDWKFLWRIIKMAGHWRYSSQGLSPIRRSTPLAIIALLHAVLIAVASIFSSKVTRTTSEVLVQSSKCGLPVFSPFNVFALKQEDLPVESALYAISQWSLERSLAYSNACYRGVGSYPYACNEFVRRYLESKVNRTEECPFPSDVCIMPALSVDTGYIDSDFHLGINAPASDRISFRKRLTCAPINADNYTPGWTTEGLPPVFPWQPDLISGAAYKFYNFGEQIYFGLVQNWSFVEANYTGTIEKTYHTMYVYPLS